MPPIPLPTQHPHRALSSSARQRQRTTAPHLSLTPASCPPNAVLKASRGRSCPYRRDPCRGLGHSAGAFRFRVGNHAAGAGGGLCRDVPGGFFDVPRSALRAEAERATGLPLPRNLGVSTPPCLIPVCKSWCRASQQLFHCCAVRTLKAGTREAPRLSVPCPRRVCAHVTARGHRWRIFSSSKRSPRDAEMAPRPHQQEEQRRRRRARRRRRRTRKRRVAAESKRRAVPLESSPARSQRAEQRRGRRRGHRLRPCCLSQRGKLTAEFSATLLLHRG